MGYQLKRIREWVRSFAASTLPIHRHGTVVHTRHGACGAYTAHQVTENADKFLAKEPPKVVVESINVRAVKDMKAARTVVHKLSTHAY